MQPNIENFIGCDSSYRAASIVLYGALRFHHQLPPRRTVRPGGHPTRKLWSGDLQPLPECRPDRF